jgi:hypothetical protein
MVTVAVRGRSAEVDVRLAEIIRCLWQLGISTDFSCQGSVGPRSKEREPWGYISFSDVTDLRRFLACFDDSELAERRYATPHATDPVTGKREPIHRRGWSISTLVQELQEGDRTAEIGRFRFRGRVGFASADIPRIEASLRHIIHDNHPGDAAPRRAQIKEHLMPDDPRFGNDLNEWLDLGEAEAPNDPATLLRTYLESYTGSRFELLADADHPDRITANDLVAVTMLSVQVPPRAAAWILDPAGARTITGLLEQIDPAPIWEQPAEVITDAEGPLTQLWSLLRAPSTQLPALADDNGIGPVIAGKLLAAKRPHLVPIYDQHVAGALGAPNGTWWRCWRTALSDDRTRDRIEEIRSLATAAQPLASSLSDLRVCDIVVWMAAHGARSSN